MANTDAFIEQLDQLKDLMKMKGEHFRARAYQKAMETLMINPTTPMKDLPNIGDGILKKFKQFQETGLGSRGPLTTTSFQ